VTPVLPPWGTIGVPLSAQIRTTSATSAVVAGRTTIGTQPLQLSRQETQCGAISSGSVVKPFSPTTSRIRRSVSSAIRVDRSSAAVLLISGRLQSCVSRLKAESCRIFKVVTRRPGAGDR
jgi:hypothetical protein